MVPFDSLGPTWLCLSRAFWDQFHKSLRYIILSSIEILKNMTLLHTVVARNEGHKIWLTLGKETRELLGFLKSRKLTPRFIGPYDRGRTPPN